MTRPYEEIIGEMLASGEYDPAALLCAWSRELPTDTFEIRRRIERAGRANLAHAEHLHRIKELLTQALVDVPRQEDRT